MSKNALVLMTAILAAIAMTACGGAGTSYDEPATAEPAAEAAPAAEAGPIEPTEAMLATLAAADAADGTTDHVVAKCPGCALAMEGSADSALQVGDYALHFCSDSCRDHFSTDVEGKLVAMKIPAAEGE
jgi:Fe-S oxidoreductase